MGGWMGPRDILHVLERRKIFLEEVGIGNKDHPASSLITVPTELSLIDCCSPYEMFKRSLFVTSGPGAKAPGCTAAI
jgi:hypothetical protein